MELLGSFLLVHFCERLFCGTAYFKFQQVLLLVFLVAAFLFLDTVASVVVMYRSVPADATVSAHRFTAVSAEELPGQDIVSFCVEFGCPFLILLQAFSDLLKHLLGNHRRHTSLYPDIAV